MGRTAVPRKKHRMKRADGVVCATNYSLGGFIRTACGLRYTNGDEGMSFRWTTRPVTCLACLVA